jgi:UDP-glucose 4-epimerase
MTKILLTGGLGFIGSHTAVVLSNMNFEVIIMDNLNNSKLDVLEKIKSLSQNPEKIFFVKADTTIKKDIQRVFEEYPNISSVIHFASLKAVNESINLPLLYYKNNLNSLINLLEVMEMYNCNKIIFSSSATVYGSNQLSPINETATTGLNITNPYGQTKYFQEKMLQDYCIINKNINIIILRYFNPVGAHPSGIIGEDPNGIPNNLFPYLLKVVSKKYDVLNIFGSDYHTNDGTCVRDFIHVMDVAEGHATAILSINTPGIYIYNLGTGKGTTVLELISTFEEVNKLSIPHKFVSRREGDIDSLYANVDKIHKEIGWKSRYSLKDICKDGYNYLVKNSERL